MIGTRCLEHPKRDDAQDQFPHEGVDGHHRHRFPARRFYERVFGWRFEPWGPPGFYRIHTGPPDRPGIEGALHAREEPLTGTGTRGFECTVSVDDLPMIRKKVVESGGELVYEEVVIESVGTLTQFRDTEGNHVMAMHYLPGCGGALA
jgi:predicted enzyme related to lactoylglutathione lyase